MTVRLPMIALMGVALLPMAPAMAAPATGAAKASAAAAADGRCILVLNVVARDPKNREGAFRAQTYFLGKFAGRGQLNDLPAILLASSKGLSSQAQLQSELKRCGAEMNASGVKLGQAFQQIAQVSQGGGAGAPGSAPPAGAEPAPGGQAPLFPPPPK